jgi:hypothetical protein
MKFLGGIILALMVGAMLFALAGLGPIASDRSAASIAPQIARGELRCEGSGAVVITVDGRDYAVNGMAGSRYPPVQTIWNKASHPEIDIDRLIVQGITLCDWGTKTRAPSHG